MLEIITRMFVMGYKLSIKHENGYARITVIDTRTFLSHSQCLPLDRHIDDSLGACIEFNIEKLSEKLNNLKNETPGV